MAKHLRLKELATTLGLSVPTVSLALRNAGNVSRETCARVQKAAAAMGYRPNPYAAALSTRWQHRNAHEMPLAIINWPSRQNTVYPTHLVMEGIERRCAELGYRLEKCHLSSQRELPQCLRVLYSKGIQGLFVAPVGDELERMKLDWSRFCVLACGRYNISTPFHTVRPEIFESTRGLIVRMLERGYRRIGAALFLHDPPLIDDYARISAIRWGMNSARKTSSVRNIIFSEPSDNTRLAGWVRDKGLDAVIVFSVGQYHRIIDEGIRVPHDVGVAVLHYYENPYTKNISGLQQQDFEIGRAAVNHMDFMIRHNERGIPSVPSHLVISSKWIEGMTLPDKTQKVRQRGKYKTSN